MQVTTWRTWDRTIEEEKGKEEEDVRGEGGEGEGEAASGVATNNGTFKVK